MLGDEGIESDTIPYKMVPIVKFRHDSEKK